MKDEETGNELRFNKHPRRKNNLMVAAMYAMYQTGASLEMIAFRYKKTRQAVYDQFKTRGYPLRGKAMNGLQVVDGIAFTLTKGGYLRGTDPTGRRLLLHQHVWEKAHGAIDRQFVLHHRDGDPGNNELTNLQLVARDKMSRTFNPLGRNQFSKKTNEESADKRVPNI